VASTSNVQEPNRTEYNAYFTSPSSTSSNNIEETTSKLIDKGKEIDTYNLTESEINRRILQPVTGDQVVKFHEESDLLLLKINKFMEKHDNNTLPNNKFIEYMNGALKVKLVGLSLTSSKYYEN
jgi:hypothetical protein